MNLSPNFTLDEFVRSDTADREGIDNTPNNAVINNLRRVAYTLEIVRLVFDSPIYISSGYRCLYLNRAVGSDDTSKHMDGLAVDFNIAGYTPEESVDQIRTIVGFNTLIQEFGRWVHLDLSSDLSSNLNNTVLLAHLVNGETHYTEI